MDLFKDAKWIWISEKDSDDEYGDFLGEFEYSTNELVSCRISCDGDYTLYINGEYVESNQYGDYEHYKIYDEFDISRFIKNGKNRFTVTVWHHGANTSRYVYGKAGVIFEVISNGNLLLSSNDGILARKNPAYDSGRCRFITRQLGFGFRYDATKESDEGYSNAVCVEKNCSLFPRPNKKLKLADEPCKIYLSCNDGGRHHLIDLGREYVGILHLDLISQVEQDISIFWGEDLQNGKVRSFIGGREFKVEYRAKIGRNIFTNHMLRFGGRYFEIYSDKPIDIKYAGLIPQHYPIEKKNVLPLNKDEEAIYKLCVRTLELCMMEHYVDCPWREQAFYAFDSRNQMLAGYYAFESGNTEYARANLLLINQDPGVDGLLSICYPSAGTRAIPSFSLHFFTSVLEYYEHTGDSEFLRIILPKLDSLIKVFIKNSENGLICKFSGERYWNFYDWTSDLEGNLGKIDSKAPDSVINLLFLKALQSYEKITRVLKCSFEYSNILGALPALINKHFYNKDKGFYSFSANDEIFTSLANALAVITGTASKNKSARICEAISHGEVHSSTLSLRCFDYDALIAFDKDKFRDFILNDIKTKYMYMIDSGATSTWETMKGSSDFDNAGSLCHGWSAIPIYYYNLLRSFK